jgi:hypothetical protein
VVAQVHPWFFILVKETKPIKILIRLIIFIKILSFCSSYKKNS